MASLPDSLRDQPDGLYGDVEGFMQAFQAGTYARAWDKLCIDKAIDDTKVRQWLQSERYNTWVVLREHNPKAPFPTGPYLPGCADPDQEARAA